VLAAVFNFALEKHARIQIFKIGFALLAVTICPCDFLRLCPAPILKGLLLDSLRNSQNFLHSVPLVSHLLDLTAIAEKDVVYEIGPGKGIITTQLACRCKRVVAVEKDVRLSALLQHKFAAMAHVEIRCGDFLTSRLPHSSYKVFSNIPFDQTAAILHKLTDSETAPQAAYLILQKEAAGRFLGRPNETLRSVLLKPWFDLRCLYTFRRGDFVPCPKVDAVLFGMEKRAQPAVGEAEQDAFCDFVTYAFTCPQPDVVSTLKHLLPYSQMGTARRIVSAGTLPSQLSLEIWLELFRLFQEKGSDLGRARVLGSEKRLEKQQAKLEKVHRTRV
jgi:23S rRNA (adenine-N6)-dimethyltransferase